MIYERITITFDVLTGLPKGGLAIPWDSVKGALEPIDLPAGSPQLAGVLDGLPDQSVAVHDLETVIAQLQQAITDRDVTIEAQRQQLSRLVIADWDRLIAALKDAGFNNWLAGAGTDNPDLLDEVARLYAAAKVADRLGVITEYMAIATQYSPSPEQLEAWQAVLDGFQPHPIPPNLLWFVQPGVSTGP